MRAPLTVRISDGVADQHITRYVNALRFTKTAPGGHHSASVSVEIPEGILSNLGPADRVYIYDGRNASTVWDGYVENPGRQSAAGGESYDLSAMGGVVLASDNARAVVFRSTDLAGAQWQRYFGTVESANVEVDASLVPGQSAIKAMFAPGSPVPFPSDAGMANHSARTTGQPIRALLVTARGGKDDAGYRMQMGITNESASSVILDWAPLTTADVSLELDVPSTKVSDGFAFLVISRRGASTNVTDNETWAAFYNFTLAPYLSNALGSDSTPLATAWITPHEVVHHVVGAMLPLVDGAASSIESTAYQIDNLAYFDGVRPSQILDDLALWEPDFLWEILESNASGKHRFAYRKWPTTPRYEISGREFTEAGGEVDLSNRIVVNWTDELGAKQTTVRTTAVEALGTRIKDAAPITLPDGMGSAENAKRIGDEILAALNSPTRSGSATISQPIFDRLAGKMVMPWEIEPGYLVRVRDRGVDLRLTEMTYEDSSVSTSITLGSPVLSLEQRIARLTRPRGRKG